MREIIHVRVCEANHRWTTQPIPWAAYLVMKGCLVDSNVARPLLRHLPPLEEWCAYKFYCINIALKVVHAAVVEKILFQPHLDSSSVTESEAGACFTNTDLSDHLCMNASSHLHQLCSLGGYTAVCFENFLLGYSSPPSTSDVTMVSNFRCLQFKILLHTVWRIRSGYRAENRTAVTNIRNSS